MKTIKIILALLFITTLTFAQKSPRIKATGEINSTKVLIDYGAPSVKERTIWGGLEKYDRIWRAGANENTTISFDKDVKINGEKLPAGKYGFFMIPKENGDWTVIFNEKNDAWGAFSYKEKEDALRTEIKPQFEDNVQEQLNYTIDGNNIIFSWDKARIIIPVQ